MPISLHWLGVSGPLPLRARHSNKKLLALEPLEMIVYLVKMISQMVKVLRDDIRDDSQYDNVKVRVHNPLSG